MRTPAAVVKQYVCEHWHTHERDWDHHPDRCRHCQAAMPLERPVIGHLHPDSGD